LWISEEQHIGWKGEAEDMQEKQLLAERHKIIDSIVSPLGFFVLALLIVEAFLGVCMCLVDPIHRMSIIYIGVFLFVVLVAAVYVLVIKFPTHLVFSEVSHLRVYEIQQFGTNTRPTIDVTAQQEMIAAPVPPQPAHFQIQATPASSTLALPITEETQ
jgi:hypothetical protein